MVLGFTIFQESVQKAWHGSRRSRESNNLDTRSESDYMAQGGDIAKQDVIAAAPSNSVRPNLPDNLVPPVRRRDYNNPR